MTRHIVDMPDDDAVRREVATWSIEEWGDQFPGDNAETYIDLYRSACSTADDLPKVYVVLDDSEVLGTVTLVDDDELPNATEPGPWLAALYVRRDARGTGVGRELVAHCVDEARRLGFSRVWLYTPQHRRWYEAMGWTFVRRADLHGHAVDVMSIEC